MSWSFSIGRLLGSELRVHGTFFLLLAYIGGAAYLQAGIDAAVNSLAFVVVLFVCVVAHEYGHALMARRYGIRTPYITLLPIGGLAQLERVPERPGQEIAVSLAGPAVNLVIWGGLLAVGAQGGAEALSSPMASENFLARLAMVNLALALFNLLPAFPMDGGRVLRALLSFAMDRVRATRVAAVAGQIAALGFAVLGVFTANLLMIVVAVFIFFAAQGEANAVARRDMAGHLKLRDATITSFEHLSPTDTLHMAGQVLIRTTQHEFPVMDTEGRLCGFLTRTALFQAMADGQTGRPVSDVMTQNVPALPLTAPLETVMDALQEAPAVAAVDQNGHVLGYATAENVGELMVLRGR